jgi:CheY-like chemotaxis protein
VGPLSPPGRVGLAFSVEDTGVGIGGDLMKDLFKPLTTGDASFTRQQGGLGMGLAISRSLARLMGGELSCQSQPGRGSVFTLRAPFQLPEQQAPEEAAQGENAYPELEGMRVLVAEDNLINQMIAEEILATVGIEVTVVNNGLEALEILRDQAFDLVLMDIQMPEMDGLTATARIRTDGRYAGMPILAMTANSLPEHREESLRSGMNDHLTKPINPQELFEALKYWGRASA